MFVSSSSTEMFSGKSKKFCQGKESTAQSSGNQGFHDVPTAAVVCTCVPVCVRFFVYPCVLGLRCQAVRREPLRDYSSTTGCINTAALNHGTALISSQVAAFRKHTDKYSLV